MEQKYLHNISTIISLDDNTTPTKTPSPTPVQGSGMFWSFIAISILRTQQFFAFHQTQMTFVLVLSVVGGLFVWMCCFYTYCKSVSGKMRKGIVISDTQHHDNVQLKEIRYNLDSITELNECHLEADHQEGVWQVAIPSAILKNSETEEPIPPSSTSHSNNGNYIS